MWECVCALWILPCGSYQYVWGITSVVSWCSRDFIKVKLLVICQDLGRDCRDRPTRCCRSSAQNFPPPRLAWLAATVQCRDPVQFAAGPKHKNYDSRRCYILRNSAKEHPTFCLQGMIHSLCNAWLLRWVTPRRSWKGWDLDGNPREKPAMYSNHFQIALRMVEWILFCQ